jgi:hypothetical protein
VVLKEKKFNDLAKFLHFYDYLPFEEDLALHVNNLKFPLPEDDLYQVWLKLAYWFRSGEDFFFQYTTTEYGLPYCGPSRPPGTMMWRNLNLHLISESFHFDMTYSGSVVLEKIFIWPHLIFAFL